MQIASIAIIDHTDKLILIENYMKSSDSYLFKFQAFTALQTINSQLQKRLLGQIPDPYLGCLYSIYLPEYEYDVFAYVTVSQQKFIIFMRQNQKVETGNVQPIFERIYGLLRAARSNPFQEVSLPKLLKPLVKEFNN